MKNNECPIRILYQFKKKKIIYYDISIINVFPIWDLWRLYYLNQIALYV